jgi:transposase
VVESTYNWYWLVDGLHDSNFRVKLANPNAIQQYKGLKHTNDKTDARWLAELSRLDILPEGHIYPKETRGIRDLLRKRGQLVENKTMHLLSIQTIIERNTSLRFTANQIHKLTEEDLNKCLADEDVNLAANSNRIIMQSLVEQIKVIEKRVLSKVKPNPIYHRLQTVPGIGEILSLTILLETGNINRFNQVGNYASYCRCVNSERISNGKKKGENNQKNGNKYLCWAYVEAANFAIRHYDTVKKFYQRKKSKTNGIVAIKTIAHKLARACYYIMRDNVEFDMSKTF